MPWSVGAIRKTLGRVAAFDERLSTGEDDADRDATPVGDAP